MRRGGIRPALAGPLLVLVLGAVGGCQGADNGDAAGPATAGTTQVAGSDVSDRNKQYARCIRDNGVPNFPDPGPNPDAPWSGRLGGLDRSALVKAMQACQDKAPEGMRQVWEKIGDDVEKWRPVARCMRENGLDVPDPDPNQSFMEWVKTFQNQPSARKIGKECAARAGVDLGVGGSR